MQGLPNQLAQGLSELSFAAFQDRGPRPFLAQAQQRAGLGQQSSAGTDLPHKPAANSQGKSPGAPAPCSSIASGVGKVEAAAAQSFSPLIAPSSLRSSWTPRGSGSPVRPCPSAASLQLRGWGQTRRFSYSSFAALGSTLCPGLENKQIHPKRGVNTSYCNLKKKKNKNTCKTPQ